MSKAVEAVEVRRVVLRVGKREMSLGLDEARELYRVLGELLGPREVVVPVVVRETVTVPAPWVPYVPVQPVYPQGPIWVGGIFSETDGNTGVQYTLSGGTAE